jgi:hypothetical protein
MTSYVLIKFTILNQLIILYSHFAFTLFLKKSITNVKDIFYYIKIKNKIFLSYNSTS